ncbi:hypothetical protein BDR07DRAFT_1378213 [Suillus spraguei]|nr:hypothetical protein BDR07DRAFT_1378213 [Suillus spraguei]
MIMNSSKNTPYIQDKDIESDPEFRSSITVKLDAGKPTTMLECLSALYHSDSVVMGWRTQHDIMQAWGTTLGAREACQMPGVIHLEREYLPRGWLVYEDEDPEYMEYSDIPLVQS